MNTRRNPFPLIVALSALVSMGAVVMAAVIVDTGRPVTLDGVEYASVEACVEAAKAGLGADARECVHRVVVRGDCSDVPMPAVAPIEVYEANPARYADPANNAAQPGYALGVDGARYTFTDVGVLEARLCPGSDTRWQSVQVRQVYESAPYPSCWVKVPKSETVSGCG